MKIEIKMFEDIKMEDRKFLRWNDIEKHRQIHHLGMIKKKSRKRAGGRENIIQQSVLRKLIVHKEKNKTNKQRKKELNL